MISAPERRHDVFLTPPARMPDPTPPLEPHRAASETAERVPPADSRAFGPRQCLRMARFAARACLTRLQAIAENSDPTDVPLRQLLTELLDEAHRRLGSLAPLGPEEQPTPLEQEWVRTHFASLQQGFGEGALNRDCALHFAECLKEEASRFYRALSDVAIEEQDRMSLQRAALAEWGHLQRLRRVLL